MTIATFKRDTALLQHAEPSEGLKFWGVLGQIVIQVFWRRRFCFYIHGKIWGEGLVVPLPPSGSEGPVMYSSKYIVGLTKAGFQDCYEIPIIMIFLSLLLKGSRKWTIKDIQLQRCNPSLVQLKRANHNRKKPLIIDVLIKVRRLVEISTNLPIKTN